LNTFLIANFLSNRISIESVDGPVVNGMQTHGCIFKYVMQSSAPLSQHIQSLSDQLVDLDLESKDVDETESCTSVSEMDIDEMREKILAGFRAGSRCFQKCFRGIFDEMKGDYKDHLLTDDDLLTLKSKDFFVKSYTQDKFTFLKLTNDIQPSSAIDARSRAYIYDL